MEKILKINIKGINAGVLGKNRDKLSAVLDKHGISYKLLNKHDKITNENMVFCVDYYKIIPASITDKLKYGVWTFHGSDLPKGRGWAPLGWALINNEPNFTLTLFKADSEMDTGMYYKKTSIPIDEAENIHSLREKCHNMITELANDLLTDISVNGVITIKQQEGLPTYYTRRTSDDSELNTNQTLKELWALIRACHNQEYPAFFKIGKNKIILRYEVTNE